MTSGDTGDAAFARGFYKGAPRAAGGMAGWNFGSSMGAMVPGGPVAKGIGWGVGGLVGAFGGTALMGEAADTVDELVLGHAGNAAYKARLRKDDDQFANEARLGDLATGILFNKLAFAGLEKEAAEAVTKYVARETAKQVAGQGVQVGSERFAVEAAKILAKRVGTGAGMAGSSDVAMQVKEQIGRLKAAGKPVTTANVLQGMDVTRLLQNMGSGALFSGPTNVTGQAVEKFGKSAGVKAGKAVIPRLNYKNYRLRPNSLYSNIFGLPGFEFDPNAFKSVAERGVSHVPTLDEVAKNPDILKPVRKDGSPAPGKKGWNRFVTSLKDLKNDDGTFKTVFALPGDRTKVGAYIPIHAESGIKYELNGGPGGGQIPEHYGQTGFATRGKGTATGISKTIAAEDAVGIIIIGAPDMAAGNIDYANVYSLETAYAIKTGALKEENLDKAVVKAIEYLRKSATNAEIKDTAKNGRPPKPVDPFKGYIAIRFRVAVDYRVPVSSWL